MAVFNVTELVFIAYIRENIYLTPAISDAGRIEIRLSYSAFQPLPHNDVFSRKMRLENIVGKKLR